MSLYTVLVNWSDNQQREICKQVMKDNSKNWNKKKHLPSPAY